MGGQNGGGVVANWRRVLLMLLVVGSDQVGRAEDQPLLQLETGGHTAICRWLNFIRTAAR
ncbi:MAG: hypothetical protein R3C49_21470 [Planctomycetaceae bacterium]